MLIDAHHHLWTYSKDQYPWIDDSMTVLAEDFGPRQLGEVADTNGVDGFVAVQARQAIDENDALLAASDKEPRIRGIVGWVPFDSVDVKDSIEKYSADDRIKGFRHVVQDEPDDQFLRRDDFNRGIAELSEFDLVYDILIFARQLSESVAFVDRHPQQRFVLDHIAKPSINEGQWDATWERNLHDLARRENVTCKFSGVVTEVQNPTWSTQTIRPYFEVALEAFTPQRLMFGSDWPVCLMKCKYGQWLAAVQELASELSEKEREALFAGTAIHTYRL